MCKSLGIELSRSMYRCARRFYVLRAWGMNLDPVTLARIFDTWQGTGDNRRSCDSRAKVNSEVVVLDLQEYESYRLTISVPQDSAPEQGVISCLSPLGAALLDKKAGDVITIPVLGSQMRYQILSVET